MKLYFGNSFGPQREIADCETLREVNIAIDKFIADCNANPNRKLPPFKRYYTRVWQDEKSGMWQYDVGSHSEFFFLSTPMTYEEMQNAESNG